MKRIRTLSALGVAAGATALTLSVAVPSFASYDDGHSAGGGHGPTMTAPRPNAAARSAGITPAGGAYMGWTSHTQGKVAPLGSPRQVAASPASVVPLATQTPGIDVASYQGNVNWSYWWGQGKRWAYVKATEGTYYTNPYFAQQYNGSYNIGMIRGAYHFAIPNGGSGASQANYFLAHGGGWSKDGKTLPGALDIEYNPYSGGTCYGLSQSAMVNWIKDFVNTYKAKTGRDPVIYTARNWWSPCTGNSTAFSQVNPLWIADYVNNPPVLFGGWPFRTFWQYTSSPLDQDYFNGAYDRLQAMANG